MLKSTRTLLAVGATRLDTFDRLKRELGKISNAQAFFIAMAWGYKHGTKATDMKRSNTGARLEYLKPQHEALLTAVHLAEVSDPEALGDIEQRLDLAEQYADGGLMLLEKLMDEQGEFRRAFAGEVKVFASEFAPGSE